MESREMWRRLRGTFGVVLLSPLLVAAAGPAERLDGQRLYLQTCAPCHGSNGRGDGPDAALFAPRPSNLREGVLETRPTADVVQRVLDAGRHPLELDLPALRARAADTAALIAYMQRLPAVDWQAADAGEALFMSRCTPCHGVFGLPPAPLPPGVRAPRDLSDPALQRSISEADMATAVRHGRAGMPALTPRLTEEEARRVAVFVRLLSPGYTTYTQYCAPCHGSHGVGAGSFAESIPAPTVIFDRAYLARRDPEELQRSVWHMLEQHRPSMPHFRGTISESEARAIVGFLQGLPP